MTFNPNLLPENVREGGAPATALTATATHAAAAETIPPAGPGLCNAIYGVAWSYSGGTLAGGRLTVKDGTATVLDLDVTVEGAGSIVFGAPLVGSPDTSMTLTLADGSASVVGKVTPLGYFQTRWPGYALPALNFSNFLNSGSID